VCCLTIKQAVSLFLILVITREHDVSDLYLI